MDKKVLLVTKDRKIECTSIAYNNVDEAYHILKPYLTFGCNLKTNLETYINHPNFIQVEEYTHFFIITMKAIKKDGAWYAVNEQRIVDSEIYQVTLFKSQDQLVVQFKDLLIPLVK